MRLKSDVKILNLINTEIQDVLNDALNVLRNEAKHHVLKVRNENQKSDNLQ